MLPTTSGPKSSPVPDLHSPGTRGRNYNQGPSRNQQTCRAHPSRRSNTGGGSTRQTKPHHANVAKVKVEGKRKIWGTWPTTSISAVKNAIKSITKIDEVAVKRKYKTTRPGPGNSARVSKWWFILNGNEELLMKLKEKWSTVKLQTNWTLEVVFHFDEGLMQEAQANVPTDPLISNATTTPSQPHGQEQVESDAMDPCSNTAPRTSPDDNNTSNSVSSRD